MSSKNQLLDTILSALSRDDGLRHTYLRQRWQGLADTRQQSTLPAADIGRAQVPPLQAGGEELQLHPLSLR